MNSQRTRCPRPGRPRLPARRQALPTGASGDRPDRASTHSSQSPTRELAWLRSLKTARVSCRPPSSFLCRLPASGGHGPVGITPAGRCPASPGITGHARHVVSVAELGVAAASDNLPVPQHDDLVDLVETIQVVGDEQRRAPRRGPQKVPGEGLAAVRVEVGGGFVEYQQRGDRRAAADPGPDVVGRVPGQGCRSGPSGSRRELPGPRTRTGASSTASGTLVKVPSQMAATPSSSGSPPCPSHPRRRRRRRQVAATMWERPMGRRHRR